MYFYVEIYLKFDFKRRGGVGSGSSLFKMILITTTGTISLPLVNFKQNSLKNINKKYQNISYWKVNTFSIIKKGNYKNYI